MVTALLSFALAATLLIVAPGPDSMLVMRNTLRGGRQSGLFTAAGTLTGLLTWAVVAGFGITAVLAASRAGYDTLKIAGGVYLVWLGLSSWWPRLNRGLRGRHTSAVPADSSHSPLPARRAYLNGVISNLCNPKIGIFFVAFLPGFMPRGASVRELSFVLGAWFVVETGLWLSALVWMVGKGAGWLRRESVVRRLERITGVVLIGLGVRLATESR